MAFLRRQITYSEHPNRAARAAHARGEKQFKTYDTSYIRPKKSPIPTIVAIGMAAIILAVAVYLIVQALTPKDSNLLPNNEEAIVVVEPGSDAQTIGQTLLDARLVSSVTEFVDAVNSADAASSLYPGTYLFSGGTPVSRIVASLQFGPASTGTTLTIPEGFTRTAIAKRVEESTNGRITYDDFMAATANAADYAYDYAVLTEAGTNSLEGFLFPKTYDLTAGDDATTVVRMMLDQYVIETASLNYTYPESQGLDAYDVLILASIIEKESDTQNIYNVASVFYNRLASDRPYLESDATTAYEVGHEPSAEEVHADTPYSTYTHEGLPPTPICSPSLECLQAACAPAQTNYMFFYFEPNDQGGVDYHFSETYEEHQEAVNG